MQGERTRCCSQAAARENAAGCNSHHESGEALEKVGQKGCGTAIPEFFQNLVYVTSSAAPPLKSFSLFRRDEGF